MTFPQEQVDSHLVVLVAASTWWVSSRSPDPAPPPDVTGWVGPDGWVLDRPVLHVLDDLDAHLRRVGEEWRSLAWAAAVEAWTAEREAMDRV